MNVAHTGTVFRIKKYAIHDGPGIRTTVFLKGCPLRCRWCHNPEGISADPQVMVTGTGDARRERRVGRTMTVDGVMAEIEKDVIFYDESGGGVTLSGGEPLMQADFAIALLDRCRQKEIHSAIDTSGAVPEALFAPAAGKADLILFDLKIIDPAAHRKFTGIGNDQILRNLECAAVSGIPVRVRFPLVPGMTDDEVNLQGIAAAMNRLTGIREIDVLPYHRTADNKYRQLKLENPMAGTACPSPEAVDRVKVFFQSQGLSVKVGG